MDGRGDATYMDGRRIVIVMLLKISVPKTFSESLSWSMHAGM